MERGKYRQFLQEHIRGYSLQLPQPGLVLPSLLLRLKLTLLLTLPWEPQHPKQQTQVVRIHLLTSNLVQQEDEQSYYRQMPLKHAVSSLWIKYE